MQITHYGIYSVKATIRMAVFWVCPRMWHVQYRWRLLTDYPEVIAWIPISGWPFISGHSVNHTLKKS